MSDVFYMGTDAREIAKAQLMAQILRLVTSETPAIIDNGDYVEIVLTNSQLDSLHDGLIKSLRSKPGAVRLPWNKILVKPLVMQYGGYLAAALAGSFIVGRVTGRK